MKKRFNKVAFPQLNAFLEKLTIPKVRPKLNLNSLSNFSFFFNDIYKHAHLVKQNKNSGFRIPTWTRTILKIDWPTSPLLCGQLQSHFNLPECATFTTISQSCNNKNKPNNVIYIVTLNSCHFCWTWPTQFLGLLCS